MAVVALENGERDIRILDVPSQRIKRLRLDPVIVNGFPVWLPDSNRIAFQGYVTGETFSMWMIAADGNAPPKRLLMNNNAQLPTSASSDGYLVFHELRAETGLDILRMKLDPSRQVWPLVETKAWESRGVVSPDGRWIASECCTVTQPEIHVSPYPNTDGVRWLISSGGGVLATWSSGSDRLFYVTRDGSLMQVAVDPRASSWTADSPRALLPAGALVEQQGSPFDISHDGRRVLTLRAATETAGSHRPRIIFVDWLAELARASQ
jgi:Tol biopolymer transport system component